MGYYKNKIIEIEERGYGESDKIVCNICFGDYALKKYIRIKGKQNKCDYCGRYAKAMHLEDVLNFVLKCIKLEYEDANECMGWDGREGGYQGASTWDTYDFVYEVLSEEMKIENDDLIKDIIDTINNITWCNYDPYTMRVYSERMQTWKEYALKAESFKKNDTEILDIICSYVQDNKLIKFFNKKKGYFRGVIHDKNEIVASAKRIGAPPKVFLATNRMSRANESVFYGADDIDTCCKEIGVHNESDKVITLAKFYPSKKLKILDLNHMEINIPSIFDEKNMSNRNSSIFLKIFASEISKPVNDNEKDKYIPIQNLAHYLKNELCLDGIAYESSKNIGHKCYVLFFENKDCVDDNEPCGHHQLIMSSSSIMKKYICDTKTLE